MTSGRTNKRGEAPSSAVRRVMYEPHVHKEVATLNGEAATAGLKLLRKLQHDPHPWDDLRRSVAVEHPVRDALWDDRNLILLLEQVEAQVYLGCN